MSDILLITEVHGPMSFEVEGRPGRAIVARDVPTVDTLVGAPTVVILGPLRDGDWGLALAGAMKLGFERGALVVFLYNARPSDFDPRFLQELVPEASGAQVSGSIRGAASSPPPDPAFAEYITRFGSNDFRWHVLPDGAEILAYAVTASSPLETAPAAFCVERGGGAFYLLPCHVVGDIGGMLECLVRSVLDHRHGRLLALPAFHAELLLPGEEALATSLRDLQTQLDQLESDQEALTRHKLLVGSVAGPGLEELVIDELNLVLTNSGIVARRVEKQGVEDFELVDEAGGRQALGESKAARGGVTLDHVNQVNSHRTELFEVGADELPGILIVNTFRNDEVRERRQSAPGERIIRHATQINVLVLRTWDLYQLVARRLAKMDDSNDLA